MNVTSLKAIVVQPQITKTNADGRLQRRKPPPSDNNNTNNNNNDAAKNQIPKTHHQNGNRRRSRSMTPMRKGRTQDVGDNNFQRLQNGNYSFEWRKTGRNEPAGMVAKESNGLLARGVRLVSTRRPITPLEPRRQLYGKLAPPGRPPSAISLRQTEFRALPSLVPIQQHFNTNYSDQAPIVLSRSQSVGGNLDYFGIGDGNGNDGSSTLGRTQGKLPPLTLPPGRITGSQDDVHGEMHQESHPQPAPHPAAPPPPPHADLLCKSRNSIDSLNLGQQTNEMQIAQPKKDVLMQLDKNPSTPQTGPRHQKQKPFKKRMTKSFDMPLGQGGGPGPGPGPGHTETIALCSHPESGVVGDDTERDGPMAEEDDADDDRSFPEIPTGPEWNLLTSRKLLTRINDPMAQSTTDTLLELLKAHSGIKECSEETVQHINAILLELYTRVKGTKGNWRSTILGGLYGLVECASPKILLAVARVVLALHVTGSNLTGACKLVFKVARNETNDYLFSDTDVPELLIDGLGRASPIDDPDACIYGYGAVRFLATAAAVGAQVTPVAMASNSNKQKSIAQRLSHHGAVQLMVLHLQILNEAGVGHKLSGPPLHALYQLSAALRALAAVPPLGLTAIDTTTSRVQSANTALMARHQSIDEQAVIIKKTLTSQDINLELACPHLVKAAEIAIGELEIQANIVRTLSVLSEHDSCCLTLSEYTARIGMLLGPCREMANGSPEKLLTLLSRLGYILGNIMARHDNSRTQFYNNDVAMEYLLEALEFYSKQKLTLHNQMGDTVVDVMIKLVRVVANMSVNQDVGVGLGKRPPLGEILLNLLLTTNQVKITNMATEIEELLHATLGALHNLCFYQEVDCVGERDGSMSNLVSNFSLALCDTIKSGPEKARPEVMRVLGNMTRNPLAREAFCAANGLKAITKCLQADEYELRATSSGVLVNLLGDWERRAPFLELKGHLILRDILTKSAQDGDWLLAAIVCQAFWNFLIDSGNIIGALGDEEADRMCVHLAEYLDEERIFKGGHPDAFWEQFAAVATDLLERIQSSFSPICSSEEEEESDEDDVQIEELQDDEEFDDQWKGRFKKWIEED